MRYLTYSVTISFILLLSFTSVNLSSQCADVIISIDSDTKANLEIPNCYLIPDLTIATDPVIDPFYQFFVDFGDGNYYYRNGEMDPFSPDPPINYPATNLYLDVDNIRYIADGFRLDRKSDDEPPSIMADIAHPTSVPPTIGPAGAAVPPEPDDYINLAGFPTFGPSVNKSPPLLINDPTSSCQRVIIDHSHDFLERDDWSAFILAYYPRDGDVISNGSATLLFFMEDHFDPNNFVKKPNYAPLLTMPSPLNSTIQIDNLPASFPAPYTKFIRFNIPSTDFDIDDPTDGIEELRLFHYIKSATLAAGFTDDHDYNFMVILASSDPTLVSGTSDPVCAENNFYEDRVFVNPYVNESSSYQVLPIPGLPTLNYIDADLIQVKSGKPEDPNHLKIIDVCECSDNGNYKISFELQFCNIAPYPTSSASVFIEDLGPINRVRCFEPAETRSTFGSSGDVLVPTGCSGTNCINCNNSKDKCINLGFDFCNGCHAEYCLNYENILKNRRTVGTDNCHTYVFTAQTNKVGWDNLIDNVDHLKACVNFHESDCELVCSYTEALDTANFQIDLDNIPECGSLGVSCLECATIIDPVVFEEWYPITVVLFAVVIVLLTAFFTDTFIKMKNDKNTDSDS